MASLDYVNNMNEEYSGNDDVVSHSAAKDVFEVLLKYIEQHPKASPMDVKVAKN